MASRGQVLTLYKTMLREASKFPDFNFRSYALRRVRDGFREARSLSDSQEISTRLNFAKENLAIIKRQVAVGHLFDINEKLSIEVASEKR